MVDEKALQDMSYGMYIVSTNYQDKNCGLVIDSLVQQNMNPPIIGISLNKESYTSLAIKSTGRFTVSVLDMNTKMDIIERFGYKSSRDFDKFKDTEHKIVSYNMPIITENTCSFYECEVIKYEELDDHTVFFAKILNAEKLNNNEPMTYRYYYDILRNIK